MPLLKQIDADVIVRTYGRTTGESLAGPLFLIGWGITLAPEQWRNIELGAPWNEFVADAAVDSVGYFGSEAVGWAAGLGATAASGSPVLGFGTKVVFDVGSGALWEVMVDRYGLRQEATDLIAEMGPDQLADWGAYYESLRPDIPAMPTPETPAPAPVGTPVPPSETAPVSATETPVPPRPPPPTSQPPTVIPTQTPPPPSTTSDEP